MIYPPHTPAHRALIGHRVDVSGVACVVESIERHGSDVVAVVVHPPTGAALFVPADRLRHP